MMNTQIHFGALIVVVFSSFASLSDQSFAETVQKQIESLQYVWEKGDQWGRVMLSLGNQNIWGPKGVMATFPAPKNPQAGQAVMIPAKLLKLPCNVRLISGQVQIIKKISKQDELHKLQQQCQNAD